MTTVQSADLALPTEHVHLPGISFSTYEALLNELEDRRRLRLTYQRGNLEIMSPSQDHERVKSLLGRMIETLTEVLDIPICSCGSMTFRDQLTECGLEPDECYYIQHEADIRGHLVKLGKDPSPDLAVEVDITGSVLDRLSIYAEFGFPEIWRYIDEQIEIRILQGDGSYVIQDQSDCFPFLPIEKIADFLARRNESDETTWIRSFRDWAQTLKR